MIERIKLIVYIFLVLLQTLLHSISFFLIFLLVLILLDIRFFVRKIRQVLLCVFTFNLIVSISYLIMSYINNSLNLQYIALINLRVLSITYSTFFFAGHTNLFSALSFSKGLSFLLALTYSQIINFKRIMDNINLAHKSRVLVPNRENFKVFSSHSIWLFFTKSIYNAKESSLAMRSRGFLDD